MDTSKLTNRFLRSHLAYTDNTESPKLMHIWSAIASASACMGRHVWLDFGIGTVYPNMYILLVGPPGTRKNTAINFATKLIRDVTSVRFAPDDTAGQRQGLIAAIEGSTDDSLQDEALQKLDIDDVLSVIESIGNTQVALTGSDRHTIFVLATEFGSFMGQNNLDLTRFLCKLFDGEDYKYQLKKESMNLKEPLLSLIGGTTPTDMSLILPPEAMGQGFMSRIILVYGAKKEKHVPPSQASLDTSQVAYLQETYGWLNSELKGEMIISQAASDLLDSVYAKPVKINDNRFMYYCERRQSHLMKLAMILCGCEKQRVLQTAHVREADYILAMTEQLMPEALGEYGLSPLATARQKLVEFVQYAGQPVSANVLWTVMRNDMKLVDFHNSMSALCNAKKLMEVTTSEGRAYVYRDNMQSALQALQMPLNNTPKQELII